MSGKSIELINADLRSYANQVLDIKDQISDLQRKAKEAEIHLIESIIESGKLYLLTVNYSRLRSIR